MGYFNLAWFAWGSAEMNLGDTVEYNTLVRVTSPYDRLATAIIKLFVHYNVRLTFHFISITRCVGCSSASFIFFKNEDIVYSAKLKTWSLNKTH